MEAAHRNDESQGLWNIYKILFFIQKWAHIKLAPPEALIRSVMTYCPTWKLAQVPTYLWKLQRLQNKAVLVIGNFPRYVPVCDLHTTFNLRMHTII
jgi:hypothetical protein